MFNTARLCAGTGHHETAVRLLEMSVSLWPLRRDSPRARIVQAALHSSGAHERHRWRLEAAILTEGMMQPWPSTLVRLVADAKDQPLNEAFATICETLDDAPRFDVGAHVLCWPARFDSINNVWQSGTVLRERHGAVRDVRLDSGEVVYELMPHAVLAIAIGGPGAVLRSAARHGSYELLETLLRRGISPFEADLNAETALHRASAKGHAACCRLLLEYRASPVRTPHIPLPGPASRALSYPPAPSRALPRPPAPSHPLPSPLRSLLALTHRSLSPLDAPRQASCDLSGTSAVNVARRMGHTHVLRVFATPAADLDLTAFAQSASPLLQVARAPPTLPCGPCAPPRTRASPARTRPTPGAGARGCTGGRARRRCGAVRGPRGRGGRCDVRQRRHRAARGVPEGPRRRRRRAARARCIRRRADEARHLRAAVRARARA